MAMAMAMTRDSPFPLSLAHGARTNKFSACTFAPAATPISMSRSRKTWHGWFEHI